MDLPTKRIPADAIFFYQTKGRYGFMSNMFVSPFTVDGRTFLTVEHYFHAQKAMMAKDQLALDAIMGDTSPYSARILGKKVDIDTYAWDKVSFDVCLQGLRYKFASKNMAELLCETGQRELYEASPSDSRWGTGCVEWLARKRGIRGRNLLGKALELVRAELWSKDTSTVEGIDEEDDSELAAAAKRQVLGG